MKARLFMAAAAATFLAGALCASEPGRFSRDLRVTGSADLDVSSGPGGVNIVAGPPGAVRVRAIIRPLLGRADLGQAQAAIRTLEEKPPIEQDGNRIRVGYVTDSSVLGRVSVTYEIESPPDSRCRVTTSSGGIQIAGLAGPATATSRSGRIEIDGATQDITARNSSGAVVVRRSGGRVQATTISGLIQVLDAAGPIEVETGSGRTEVSDATGHVKSRTTSGSIIVNRAKAGVHAVNGSGSIDAHGIAGEIDAQTRSGAIRISQATPAGITARSGNGAIQVALAHGGGYDLDAQSETGKVAGLVPDGADGVVQPRRVRGQIRGGGPLVDLDTRSSKITVN